MFLKKFLCLNNVVVNCKQFESLFQAVKAAPSISLKQYSCQPISEDLEVTMNVCMKDSSKSVANGGNGNAGNGGNAGGCGNDNPPNPPSGCTNYEVKNVPGSKVGVAKAPFWNRCNESLLYTDLSCGRILRYDTKSNEIKKAQIKDAESASFIMTVEGQENQFIVGNKRNIELVQWDGNSENACIIRTITCVQKEEQFANNRMAGGMIDDQGRLFAGTMADGGNEFEAKLGDLYMIDGKDAKASLNNLGIPSGMAINKDGNKIYIVDGGEYAVKEFDYSAKDGSMTNPKVIYAWDKSKVPQHMTVPDGLTIDAEGNLYVGSNAGTIYKIDPATGKICLEIKLPVRQVTGMAFGGQALDTLYVTSGSKFEEPSPAGQLFTVTGLGATGLPTQPFKIKETC